MLIVKKKRICQLINFVVRTDLRMKMEESEKIDEYLELVRKLKKLVRDEGGGNTNYSWWTWSGPEGWRNCKLEEEYRTKKP